MYSSYWRCEAKIKTAKTIRKGNHDSKRQSGHDSKSRQQRQSVKETMIQNDNLDMTTYIQERYL
jgi:hypothetical protein